MGLNNGLHNVPVRIEPGQSSLAPPPFNNNNIQMKSNTRINCYCKKLCGIHVSYIVQASFKPLMARQLNVAKKIKSKRLCGPTRHCHSARAAVVKK